MSKVISFIKDPHVVIECRHTDNATLLCNYRVLVQDDDGGVYIRSLAEIDIDGDLDADDIINSNYEECEIATKEIIQQSIDAWLSPERNGNGESPKKTAEYVLRQFLRASMIDKDTYREILSEYE